ncbi:MAG: FAD-binding protein [Coriobacteriales bacterium]|nr:FAD-binding protein [Coriobacteriales bacterium]
MANVSRRTFLGTAGLAAASVASGAAVAVADEVSQNIVWDEEADIVILGFGLAGINAAKVAGIDEGMSVIVLEKAPETYAGGATRVNGGTAALLGATALLYGSFGAIDQDLYDAMAAEDSVFVNWFTNEVGVNRVNDMFIDGYGRALWEGTSAKVLESENITVHFLAPALKLIKGSDGEVHGVKAFFDEKERFVKARKAVIVCTGSYVGNKELVWGSHYPYLPYEICNSPYNEGDGVFMIADAGGAVMKDTSLALEFFGWAMEPASAEVGTAMLMEDMNWRQQDFTHARIYVNKNGKRFMAEDIADTHDRTTYRFTDWAGIPGKSYAGGAGNGYINLPMWAVMDSKVVDAGCLWMSPEWSPAHVYGWGSWSEDNQAEVEKGWLLKADTLEELAAKMTSTDPVTGEPVAVDVEGFLATVEEYNALCASGEEDPLGKDKAYLTGIDAGPFYAVELVPALGYTNSGVPSNNNSQVLTWNNEVVPRLYAAGDVGQGMRCIMLTMNGCAARGAIAARHAAGLENWE